MNYNCRLYVREIESGKIHRVGEDIDDSLYVTPNGVVHYYNQSNGYGTNGGYYEFVPSDCGELGV